VFHPRHGHGTVTSAGAGHVAVRFGSGAVRTFPVRPDPGPSHFELMTDDQVMSHLGDGTGERFKRAMAELGRRDRAEIEGKIRALHQAPRPRDAAGKDKLYKDLTDAGENPEDAWSYAHGVTSEAMQRQAVIAQLREQGYRGASFDALTRDAFKQEVHRQAIDAETATNGYMLNKAGKAAGIDPWSLMTGPESRARAYASPELRQHWDANGRPTVKAFQQQLLGHAAAAGPAGGDFLR
jgi:hypothetical protein